MSIYYQSPQPFIGGRQPLEERRLPPDLSKKMGDDPPWTSTVRDVDNLFSILKTWIPPSPNPPKGFVTSALPGWSVDNPPIPSNIDINFLNSILRSWQPRILTEIEQSFILPESGPYVPDDPPFSSMARRTEILYDILVGWIPPPPKPQEAKKLSSAIEAIWGNNPPFIYSGRSGKTQSVILSGWIPDPLRIQITRYFPNSSRIDDPPFVSGVRASALLHNIIELWDLPEYEPIRRFTTSALPGWSIDNPPIQQRNRDRLIDSWYQELVRLPELKKFVHVIQIDNPQFGLKEHLWTIIRSWQPVPPTPQMLRNLLNIILGKMTMTFDTKIPTITFSSERPEITFTEE